MRSRGRVVTLVGTARDGAACARSSRSRARWRSRSRDGRALALAPALRLALGLRRAVAPAAALGGGGVGRGLAARPLGGSARLGLRALGVLGLGARALDR